MLFRSTSSSVHVAVAAATVAAATVAAAASGSQDTPLSGIDSVDLILFLYCLLWIR